MIDDLILLVLAQDYTVKSWLAVIRDNKISLNVQVARTTDEALAFLYDGNNPAPRMILLDMELPPGEGVRLLQTLKMDSAKAHIPVITLVFDGTRKYVNEALDAGADGYIVSAVDYEEYRKEVESFQQFWANVSNLAPSAKHWPGWISQKGADVEPSRIKREYILLIQAEEYEGKKHAANVYEQLTAMRVEQLRSLQMALGFLLSGDPVLPRYMILDLTLPSEEIRQFMKAKNDDPMKRLVPVVGLVSDKGMPPEEVGITVTLPKPTTADVHRANIIWMETFWMQPERLKA